MSEINLSRDSIETIIDALEIALARTQYWKDRSGQSSRVELAAALELMLTLRQRDAEFKPSQAIVDRPDYSDPRIDGA